ncbi:hypothetical protein [Gordonia sp. FQ]|uniref:hypothetical protein n=1 Tax=Gordonia sp. FQ TaxID=3446634 RepID=UPI003F87812A
MDEDLTSVEADQLFEETRPIGEAIHVLGQAEEVVAALDELSPAEQLRVNRAFSNALSILSEQFTQQTSSDEEPSA